MGAVETVSGDGYAHSKWPGVSYIPTMGHSPDKIANRPEFYLEYVNDLIEILGGSKIDLFTLT